MTLFGAFWMLLIVWGLAKKNIEYIITIVIVGMIWQCNNVFELNNGISVGPQLITSAAFLFKSALYRFKRKYKPDPMHYIWGAMLLWVMITCFIRRQNENTLAVIVLMIYVCTFIQLGKFSSSLDSAYTKKVFLITTWLVIGIGFVQMLIEFLNLPKQSLVQMFVYNDVNDVNICYNFKNVKRFYSSFMEPSYVAPFLVGAFYFVLSCTKTMRVKGSKVLMTILFLCILLTKSSTAYGAFAIVALIYAMTNSNDVKVWLGAILAFFVGLYLLFGTELIKNVIFDKFESSSGVVRSNMNRNALESFWEAPVIGVGYKMSRGSSIVPTLLGELGFVALVLYVGVVVILLKDIIKKRAITPSAYMVLSAMVCQIIACPDLDLCTFWMAMYFYAISFKQKDAVNVLLKNDL